MRLIIATNNQNKLKEIKRILKGLEGEILSLKDLPNKFNIKERGKSFSENAWIKAKSISKVYKEELIVGEDSGLEVPRLGNRPGIFSRRYAGTQATDEDNNLKLLKELKGIPFSQRRAQYRCALVLMKRERIIKKFHGSLKGFIYHKPVGKGGFGYDPIFYLPRYKKTVAQLSLKAKNKISHRAKAFQELKKFLISYDKKRKS